MRETRFLRRPEAVAELRAKGDGKLPAIAGYAAVFGQYSQNLGGFVEMIAPGAFDRVLRDPNREVLGLFNHEDDMVLGARSSGTLTLAADEVGLSYNIDTPDTTTGRDLVVLVERRDVTGSSFSFTVAQDGVTWSETEQGYPLRVIENVAALYDVGPVSCPAYLGTQEADTSVALRSLADAADLPLDAVIAAAERNELRALLAAEDPAGDPDPDAPGDPDASRLVLHRARLALAARAHPPTR